MNKYQYAKNELKALSNADEWKYFKTVQRQFADAIINSYVPDGCNAVTVPFEESPWYFPLPRRNEKKAGYKSRLMAWLWIYLSYNLTKRDGYGEILDFLYPEDLTDFCLEGVRM